MLTTSKKSIFFWMGFGIVISFIYLLIPPKYSFYGDPLIKLLMSKSLLLQNFQSINYFYFFKDYDPNFTYFPIDYHLYHIQKENLHFGPFGFSFSFFSAILLKFLPYSYLPPLSSLVLFLLILYLRKAWELRYSTLSFLLFCTSALIYVTEFSENIFFIFLYWICLSILLKDGKNFFLDSFLASLAFVLSVSFRLESLMYLAFFLPIFVYVYHKNLNIKKLFLFLCFSSAFLGLFFLGNFLIYGHILGSKYLADKKNFFLLSQKIMNYISLWFGVKEEMFFKPGFFGLTPLFFLIFLFGFQKWKSLSNVSKVFLLSSVVYASLAPFFAPHDGHWSWGARYLSLLILPLCIVLDELQLLSEFWNSVFWKKVVLSLLLGVSLFQVFLGIFIVSVSSKVMQKVQESTEKIESDFRLFHNGILALHTGPQVLETHSLLVKNEEELEKLLPILKSNFEGKTVAYLHSEKLESLLQKGNVTLNLNEKTMLVKLSENLEFQKEESFGDFLSVRKYRIPTKK